MQTTADLPTSSRLLIVSFDNAVLLETVRTAGEASMRPELITTGPLGPGGQSRYLGRTIQVRSPADVLEKLTQGEWSARDTLLLPLDEAAVLWVAERRERLQPFISVGLTPSPENYQIGINKARLAHRLVAAGLPGPCTWYSSNWGALTDAQFPVIIKPVDLSFGAGLAICHDRSSLERAVQSQQANGHDFVVQEFVEGYDIDCSVFCVKGRIEAWTIQREQEKSEWFSPATTIEFVEEPDVLHIVRRLMHALSWEGIAHIDLRYDNVHDRFLILEINGRFWGSMLASDAAGVNFIQCIVAHWKDEHALAPTQKHTRFRSRGSGCKYILRGQLKWSETMLPYILRDPLPEWERLREQRRTKKKGGPREGSA